MQSSLIKEKLHQFIDSIDDKRANAIYMLLEDEFDVEAKRKNIIMEDRAEYLKGNNKTFSFEEVKQMALNKELRSGL